jgi:hypothetical protein
LNNYRVEDKLLQERFFCFIHSNEEEAHYMNLLCCEVRSFPFNYLGIPIHCRKLKNSEFKAMEDHFEKKLASWMGKLLSYGDRLVHINSVLTSLPIFMMSFFEIPKGVQKIIYFYTSQFFGKAMAIRKI